MKDNNTSTKDALREKLVNYYQVFLKDGCESQAIPNTMDLILMEPHGFVQKVRALFQNLLETLVVIAVMLAGV